MTAENRIDKAIDFLVDDNKRNDSYTQVTELKGYLTREGIPVHEHLPIVFHLIKNGYASAFVNGRAWKGIENSDPENLKITFRGIKFHEKGGYEGLLKKDRAEKISKRWSLGLTVVSTLVAAAVGAWLGTNKVPDPINVKINPPLVIHDTTFVHQIDTVFIER